MIILFYFHCSRGNYCCIWKSRSETDMLLIVTNIKILMATFNPLWNLNRNKVSSTILVTICSSENTAAIRSAQMSQWAYIHKQNVHLTLMQNMETAQSVPLTTRSDLLGRELKNHLWNCALITFCKLFSN